ncbi:MAG TPA: cation:proton antiporter [bacterium]
MAQLNPDHIVSLFLTLGTLLAVAWIFGEVAARFRQPAVVGEIVAGIVLGPTVLGRVSPSAFAYLFPPDGPIALSLSGITNLALVLFLLVAGMEVDLSAAIKQGRAAISLSITGIAVPFTIGLVAAWLAPELFGMEPDAELSLFALFFATALSITALPVIAKTLMDLHIYKSDLGVLIMAAAVCSDLAGWVIFAVILGLLDQSDTSIYFTIAATIGYWVVMLAGGRWAFNRLLPFVQAYAAGARSVLVLAATVALFGAAFTEAIGIHAIFGSFIVGVAFGDSPHLRQQTRQTLNDFVSFIFAPLFFASIGLGADFVAHFDVGLVLAVTLIACLGKGLGCLIGGRLGGLSRRETWAAAAGLNARGAMEIILGLLGLRFGLIGTELFVALVVMALFTSLISGPLLQRILRPRVKRRVVDFMTGKTFLGSLTANDRDGAIRELCAAVCPGVKIDPDRTGDAVIARELLGSTALGYEVAVPHARIDELDGSVVGVGLSRDGIDFDAPDGEKSRMVFLLLTPARDVSVQLEILADIAQRLADRSLREKLIRAPSYTEFRALMKTAPSDSG